jgi:hypothetical protein
VVEKMQRVEKPEKSEAKIPFFCIFAVSVLIFPWLLSGPTFGQQPRETEQLFSPSVGQRFYEIAYELASADADDKQIKQAIIFLSAALGLDGTAIYTYPVLIDLVSRQTEHDYSQMVYVLLKRYVDEKIDLEVVRKAVRYLLDRLDSREQREELLKQLLKDIGGKSVVLDSQLYTLLGLLTAETSDIDGAGFYLMQAYNSNKYNNLAFAKLTELMGEQIGADVRLEQLRRRLSENPLDMNVALAFAEYSRHLELYETAVEAYGYCSELFYYLNPSQPLPERIYLGWTLSSYNSSRNQHKCLQIASQIRRQGRFDLSLEAVAGMAAAKIGEQARSAKILAEAEEKAITLTGDGSVSYEQMAWFYCFVVVDEPAAVDRANRAFSKDPNSPTTAAILAYSLVLNGQNELAKLLIDNYQRNQVSELALAKIQLAEQQKSLAMETLKSAIKMDAASLAAARAREILSEIGGEYIGPVDPDVVTMALRGSFGVRFVPVFASPDKIISVRLNMRGSKFSYGSDFGAAVTITNDSSEPLIISDQGLFTGNIRIDVVVSGDINERIEKLVSIKVRPAAPVKAGQSLFVPVRIITSRLRDLLLNHPQADLEIELLVYIDPVIGSEGSLSNRFDVIPPARVVVNRAGINLTAKYLQSRVNSLSRGRSGQKIQTSELFAGLLKEHNVFVNRQPTYKLMYADWMGEMLISSLVHNLKDKDWVVKIHTMAQMLALPLEYELVSAAADNLNDVYWPVRVMAIVLLSENSDDGFAKVLDWTAKYDSNNLVRDMAVALGGTGGQAEE